MKRMLNRDDGDNSGFSSPLFIRLGFNIYNSTLKPGISFDFVPGAAVRRQTNGRCKDSDEGRTRQFMTEW